MRILQASAASVGLAAILLAVGPASAQTAPPTGSDATLPAGWMSLAAIAASLEEQGFVHFVFGHATLGTLHRAEHHASHPFGETPPDVPRLVRQLIGFLVEGAEPRWLTERPEPGAPATRADTRGDTTLELPLQ